MLKKGTKVVLSGVVEKVDSEESKMPYYVRFADSQILWFGDDVCKPLKTKVVAKTSTNKRSAVRKGSPKSRKPRLRTA